MQHPILAVFLLASRPRIICTCFNNNRFISNRRTMYSLMAVLRHCTIVVSTTEASCRMAWSLAFDPRLRLEAEKMAECTPRPWMSLYNSMPNARLHSYGGLIKCTPVQPLRYMLSRLAGILGYHFNNLTTVVVHLLAQVRILCRIRSSDYHRASPT
jgi:hypothetical protein